MSPAKQIPHNVKLLCRSLNKEEPEIIKGDDFEPSLDKIKQLENELKINKRVLTSQQPRKRYYDLYWKVIEI